VTFARFGVNVVAALVPLLLSAQSPPTGSVTGRITARDDSALVSPVSGATISIPGSTVVTSSAADGRFFLDRVPTGPHTLRVRLLGYRTVEQAIVVRAADTTRVEITMRSEAQLLAPVRTNAAATEAELFTSRPNVATIAMSAKALAGVPSVGEPDVVRVVQLLPGVEARNDYNTGLNVRGGEADQNLVLLDGFPIYNPFHMGGLFSTFMDATVGGINLVTGAFPASYGGRLSSVLDVRSAEDARPGTHASADLSVLSSGGRVGSSFGGGRGTWSVAARRTYADAMAGMFTSNVFPYHFRDAQAHFAYALPGDVRLSVTGYDGKDVLDLNLATYKGDSSPPTAKKGQWGFHWGNRMLGASLARNFGERLAIEQRVSTSSFNTTLDLGSGAIVQRSNIRDVRLGGTLRLTAGAHDGSLGWELASQHIRYGSEEPATQIVDFDIRQQPKTASAWLADLWRLSPRWLVEGGVRAEALSGGGRDWAALSPRVSLKFFATPDFAFTAAAGRVTQTLHSLAGDGPFRFFDVWLASDSLTPVGAAWHWIAGAERRMRNGSSVKLEAYVKRYDRVLEANASEDPQRVGDELLPARGLSYGLDMLARWQRGTHASGWISYSYALASRWNDAQHWWPGHDRRHDLNLVGTWQFAKYRVGARFGFASGTPYTPIVGEIARRQYDPSRDHWGTGDPQIYIEPLGAGENSARYPATHRLDLETSRDYHVRGATLSPYLSLVNVYNAKNVFVYRWDYSTDRPTRRAISQFPTLPSLGVRVVF